ncbi:MAG TPA: PA2779 family protein [Burkholderiales bacterium]
MKRILGILAGLLLLAAAPAQAGMISSDAAIPQPPSARERVEATLARPDVQQELEKMGITPAEASARVQAMSDTEVAQVAGRLDSLPAGAAITNDELLLIIIIILLVALLI